MKRANTGAWRSAVCVPARVVCASSSSLSPSSSQRRGDTWSNHVSGEWVGVYSAFTPWAGQPEPVWMDERGK